MKKSLRFISVVLSVLMVVSVFAIVPAFAAETDKSAAGVTGGFTGDCIWSLNSDKTLIISGSGEMENYTGDAPWKSYSDQIYSIIIEDGVEYIGQNAFRNLSNVTFVYIPSSVKIIGEWAFYECTALRNVVLNDGIETISDYAFLSTALKSVSVPKSVTKLGSYSLGYNENKNNYSYPPVSGFTIKGEKGSTAEIYANKCGFSFLESDTKISHLYLTVDTDNLVLDTDKKESDYDEVTEGIYDNTDVDTEGCKKHGGDTCFLSYYDNETETLKTVPFKDGGNINPEKKYYILYMVGVNEGYDFISGIKKYINDNEAVDKIQGFSLSLNGEELTDAYVRYNEYRNSLCVYVRYDNFYTSDYVVEELSDGTVKITKYRGKDEDVYIPQEIDGKKVSAIGYEAFFGCHNTKYVDIPETVKKIEEKAFYYCGVENVDLSEGLEEVGANAFCTNTGIKEVIIPASVKTIGSGAFGTRVGNGYNPEKMESCIIHGKKDSAAEAYANDNGFEFVDVDAPFMINLTYDLNGGTVSEDSPEDVKKQFEETGKVIIQSAAGDYISLKKDVVSQTIVPPEGKDFDAIEFNGSRYEFGQSYGLAGDTTVKFLWKDKEVVTKHTVTYDYNGATLKTELENPKALKEGTTIDFTGEIMLVLDPPLGKTLDYVTVNGEKCENPDKYTLTKDITVKYIWKSAPASGKVGDCSWSFDASTGTLTISGGKEIPDMEENAPWYPFRDKIKKVVIDEGIEKIGSLTFYNLKKLTSVELPSTLKTIGSGAFASTGLDHISIPKSVTDIGKCAFGYEVDILTGVTSPVKGFTIYADKGTAAETYAGGNSIKIEDYSKAPAEPDSNAESKTDTKTNTETSKKAASKKANTITVKAKTKSVKLKKLKKKNQTFKALTVSKAKGKVTYTIVKKGTSAKIYKYLKISKKGVITFKKWKKAKKGSYKIKVKITAAGNKTYKSKTVNKVFKVKVK